MAIETWGQLAKSQDDPELIEEAIARLIAEHESDPDSHLGAGESLEAHRAQDIVDHPQGSVLGDKFSNKEFALHLAFESLDKYQKSVAGIDSDIAGFRLDTGSTINTVRYLYAAAQYSNTYYKPNRATTFQFIGSLYATTNQIAYIVAGGEALQAEPPGVGFKFLNGSLYAVETVWGDPDFEEYASEITGIDITAWHVYRVQVVPVDNAAYFYVDGVLKATLTLHTNFDFGLVMWSSYIKNTAAEQKQLYVNGVYISINPI